MVEQADVIQITCFAGNHVEKFVGNSLKIILIFNGPLGYTHEIATLEGVAAAIADFNNRFGLDLAHLRKW